MFVIICDVSMIMSVGVESNFYPYTSTMLLDRVSQNFVFRFAMYQIQGEVFKVQLGLIR